MSSAIVITRDDKNTTLSSDAFVGSATRRLKSTIVSNYIFELPMNVNLFFSRLTHFI